MQRRHSSSTDDRAGSPASPDAPARSRPVPAGAAPGAQRSVDRDLFDQIGVAVFEATPASIGPFGQAELRWDVVGPDGAFSLILDGRQVVARGTRTVSPPRTRTYELKARVAEGTRRIASVEVEVGDGDCRADEFPARIVIGLIEGEVEAAFAGNDQVALRGAGVSARIVDGGVAVSVPLTIDVPKWFDAAADVDLAFTVRTEPGDRGHRVWAGLARADADVRWSWYEHLAGLGSTSAVQGALQRLMEAMIREVLGSVWAEQVRAGFQDLADRVARSATEDEGRQFVLRSLELRRGESILVQVCAAEAQPGRAGDGAGPDRPGGPDRPEGPGRDGGAGSGPGSGSGAVPGPVRPPRGPARPGGGVQPR